MPKSQQNKTIINSQKSITPLEPTYPTIEGPEYFNIDEGQQNKTYEINCMNITEVFTKDK